MNVISNYVLESTPEGESVFDMLNRLNVEIDKFLKEIKYHIPNSDEYSDVEE
jgi:hypothetical protein